MPLREIYERTTERVFEVDFAPLPVCTPVDPFGIDHDCLNPAGHQFVYACGKLACCHCARIPWP